MDERAALSRNRIHNRRMVISERVDADAAEQVEVLRTVLVLDVDPVAAYEKHRAPLVRGEEQAGFRSANLFEFHCCITSLGNHHFGAINNTRTAQIGKGTGGIGGEKLYALYAV